MKNEKYSTIKRTLLIILILNIIVTLIKLILGYNSKSNSILSDGIHSFSDSLNNIVGLIIINFAYKPADKNHPYGHKKFEDIISLLVGFLLLVISFNIIKSNILNFDKTSQINYSTYMIMLMIITIFINIIVAFYEKRIANQINSSFLFSDAMHTLSDVYVSTSVLISIILIRVFNFPLFIDKMMAIFVGIIILKTSISIIISSSKVLSDYQVIDENIIREIVMSFEEVNECHLIKSRGYQDDLFLEMHILVDPLMSVQIAHMLHHDIEAKIRDNINKNMHIITHIEPNNHIH
ncbi:MAG: cation diffusion facilitator family transporter [Bacilli bacterium]|nr:cation diffusion facilitator family transporter [Bacilli bacterium]